jgi:hypothetical protein
MTGFATVGAVSVSGSEVEPPASESVSVYVPAGTLLGIQRINPDGPQCATVTGAGVPVEPVRETDPPTAVWLEPMLPANATNVPGAIVDTVGGPNDGGGTVVPAADVLAADAAGAATAEKAPTVLATMAATPSAARTDLAAVRLRQRRPSTRSPSRGADAPVGEASSLDGMTTERTASVTTSTRDTSAGNRRPITGPPEPSNGASNPVTTEAPLLVKQ